ncbi:MAG TPA: HAD family hydrolase [Marinilabiliales bacterium]|jgi:D-glycero-D-manno-heptose 1,7-bisphosphate phosphatase|nr:HAD family hydrolase [Marinilabiliales bacterium]HAZ01727.1 HAD family hydrolase [Marinilabiliales bacterium]HBO73959.1 HAD family hydrolase [Marinilabiliales bacterium]HBX85740.1 HAD family hydrolase [Marinilabiliales bacterium]HBY51529.1 HAD family hydrolase [Marinilabiliales bacterium]
MFMRKVVFLDRDGVINDDTGHYYIYKPDDFVFNKGLIESLQTLKLHGFEFVVISNQGGISRGTYTKDDVEKIHVKMIRELKLNNIQLLAVYYCPHHDKIEKCLCRKPNSLMIEKAMARFQIDPKLSYLIGDNSKDVEAAHKAGIKGIKIDTNQSILTVLDQIIK